MHFYCSSNAVTVLNAAKSLKIRSKVNFINFLPAFHLPASQPAANQPASQPASQQASQPAIRPGSASAMALEFLHNKGNCVGFTKLLF